MKKGQYQKAYDSLIRLRNNPIQAARDLYYIHSQLELEAEIIGTNNYLTRFIELFTIVGTLDFLPAFMGVVYSTLSVEPANR